MKKRITRTGVSGQFDRVYIDTSTLMNYDPLRLFLGRYEHRGLKIIMPASVRLELARHIDSGIPDKAEKSLGCIRVMDEYPGLIVLDGGILPEDLMYSTHADREILAMLTRDKGRYRQLLITNDSDLAADALALNSQLSCPGNEVSVRRINRKGKLRPFREKKLASAITAAGKATTAEPVKDNVPVADLERLVVSMPEPLCAPKIPEAPVSVSPTDSVTVVRPYGVPVPLFVLGMIGSALLGAAFGAAVSPHTPGGCSRPAA